MKDDRAFILRQDKAEEFLSKSKNKPVMTNEEAIDQLKFIVETMPKDPPTWCDYVDEWIDTNKATRNALEMGIKALGQKPCVDAVSRDDVKKALRNRIGESISNCINAIPPVTPIPNWIPVSERLPNLADYIGPRVWQQQVLITGYLSFDDTKDLFVSEAFAKDVIHGIVHDTVVVAWMPKPKPYKPESDDMESEYEKKNG